jgi:hypothetical protein
MLCCVPRQRPPLDNASVSGIAGPRAPGTASANTAIDGARLQPGCGCYITPGTRAPRRIRKFSREPQPQWPRRPGLRARVRDLRGQNTIPDFYPGLVKTAPENLFNNRQWRPRRPSTRGWMAIAWLSVVPPSPMGPQTPSRPTSSTPTDQARFQWGLQQRGRRKTSITSQPQPKAPELQRTRKG